MRQLFTYGAIALLIVFIAIQFVPVDRTNPPVSREIRWDSPETRLLVQRACFDCHSNETLWPWYSRIAPGSFIIDNTITKARRRLNFSEWDQPNRDFEKVEEMLSKRKMPPMAYQLSHPEARLTEDEIVRLMVGLRVTFQQDPPVER